MIIIIIYYLVLGQHPPGNLDSALGFAMDRFHGASAAVLFAGYFAFHFSVAIVALDQTIDARVPHVVVHQDACDLCATMIRARNRVELARL